MHKQVYVVAYMANAKPEDRVWTISEDPDREGWETDSSCDGYGLTKEKAEFYAKCINEVAERELTLSHVVVDYIKSDLERMKEPLLLELPLEKSKGTPIGKPIILKLNYGRGRL